MCFKRAILLAINFHDLLVTDKYSTGKPLLSIRIVRARSENIPSTDPETKAVSQSISALNRFKRTSSSFEENMSLSFAMNKGRQSNVGVTAIFSAKESNFLCFSFSCFSCSRELLFAHPPKKTTKANNKMVIFFI